MDGFFRYSLDQLPFVIISLIVAFTIHEWAHAYVAYKCGDPTAKMQGRLTLNPVVHLDPIGTLFILIAGFGWARPVPVDRSRFKRPHLYSILVSAAGPISNLLIAFLVFVIWYSLNALGLDGHLPQKGIEFVNSLIGTMIQLNLVLFVFNLIPFPPLDGYRILEDLAPRSIRLQMMRYEHFGSVIFLLIILTPLDQYLIQPLFSYVIPAIGDWMDSIVASFFM